MESLPRTQLEVLVVLATRGRTHAYDIKLRLEGVLGHSSVYAALSRAQAKGFVTAEWEAPGARPPGSGPLRKYYELTPFGRQALSAHEARSGADPPTNPGFIEKRGEA